MPDQKPPMLCLHCDCVSRTPFLDNQVHVFEYSSLSNSPNPQPSKIETAR